MSIRSDPRFKKGLSVEQATLNFICRHYGYNFARLSLIDEGTGKGPRMYTPPNALGEFILPDGLCVRKSGKDTIPYGTLPTFFLEMFFAEMKSKSTATFYRKNAAWQSGIDRHLANSYWGVECSTGIPVYIFHLVERNTDGYMDWQEVPPNERPNPTGLFVHTLNLPVAGNANRWDTKVYWKLSDMYKMAELSDIIGG